MSPPLARLVSRVAGTLAEPLAAGSERRRQGRTARIETIRLPAGTLSIVDVSAFGCCVRNADPAIGPGHFVGLTFPRVGTISGYVRWREDENAGIEFCRAISPAAERALATDEPLESIRLL